ncbi:glycerophosphodiester phosphodiesterase [Marinimicrococcus flavescens]|uniref:Glycerophosphodiester phosphodiesterase family protein n=1 Tax=Marinimicrococcus flavescens TaxID=3031815 RepID=A0AAP3XRV8_9PROT|nr:glycerophosphodiester phosphodiesterase family protein [Marinimicrococcus flavescens]
MTSHPRLKWHKLRRRMADAPFRRDRLAEGLAAGAAIEVDLVASADGHFVCLHDLTLDRETTGSGPVRAMTRAQIGELRQRGGDGSPLSTPPLFLEEVVAAVEKAGPVAPGTVQLDVKEPLEGLTAPLLERFGRLLGGSAASFTASGCDWAFIERLREAAPGIHAGFDPLRFYGKTLSAEPAWFEELAARTVATAPEASIYYLEGRLVLAGLDAGVNLVERVKRHGAEVDCWTIDPGRPDLESVLRRLIGAGADQITTNDPEALAPMIR